MKPIFLLALAAAACGSPPSERSVLYHCGGFGWPKGQCPTGFVCESTDECCDLLWPCAISPDNPCSLDSDCLPHYRCDSSMPPAFCRPASHCDPFEHPCPASGEYCKAWELRGQTVVKLHEYNGYCVPYAQDAGALPCTDSRCPAPFTCLAGRCHVACGPAGECPAGLSCQPLDAGPSACLP